MKKITGSMLFISIVLIIQMFLCSSVYAENEISKELFILEKLGIITSEEIEVSGTESAVTRAEFAMYSARALQLVPVENKIYFNDVPLKHWANSYVSALVDIGAVDLAADAKFNPENNVTPEQAYKIMLVAIGYKEFAQNQNDIMAAYAMVAKQAKIDISTENPKALNLNEAAKIIYNSMRTGIVEFYSTQKGAKKGVVGDRSLLDSFSIYEGEGIVTSVYGASTDSKIIIDKSNIAYINENKFIVDDDVNIVSMFGKNIEFVYKKEKDDILTLIYAEPVRNKVLNIDYDLLENYDANSRAIEYYKDENSSLTRRAVLPKGVKIVYNGTCFSGNLSKILFEFKDDRKKGSITLIDNSSDSEYELLIIKSYDTVVAKEVNAIDDIIYDYYSNDKNITLYDYEVVKYIYPDGSEAQKPVGFPVVLNFAASEDKSVAEIVVCNDFAEGQINKIYEAELKIGIEDEIYKIDKKTWDKFSYVLSAGKNVKVYMDYFGDVAYISTNTLDGMQVGYLIDIVCVTKGFDTKYMFKIYTGETVKVFELNDRVKLDNIMYKIKDYRNFFLKFPDIQYISADDIKISKQIIRFAVDSDERIKEIDTINCTAYEDEKNTLSRHYDGSKAIIYNNGPRRFGLDVLYSSTQTKLFVVPQTDENNCVEVNGVKRPVTNDMYTTTKFFDTDHKYFIATYNYDQLNPYTDVIVAYGQPEVENRNVYMVDEFYTKYEEDNGIIEMIDCYTKAGVVSYKIDDTLNGSLSDIEKGDLVQVTNNTTEDGVVKVKKLFDAETKIFNNGGSNLYWYAGKYNPEDTSNYRSYTPQLSKSYVYDVVGNVISSSYEPEMLTEGKISEAIDYKLANINIIVLDKDARGGQHIYVGTVNDIKTYINDGFDCSTIVVTSIGASIKNVFVYR